MSFFKHSYVAGVSLALPRRRLHLADLNFGERYITRTSHLTGIEDVCLAEPGQTVSDYAVQAAKYMFSEMEVDCSTIDSVVFVSGYPDYPQPCTAGIIQEKLGLRLNMPVFDINHLCSGFIYGIYQASLLIESGACHNVLLCMGDFSASTTIHPKDKSARMVAGDSACAVLISRAEDMEFPEEFSFYHDGSRARKLGLFVGGTRYPHRPGVTDVEKEDENGNIQYFSGLPEEQQKLILESKLLVYVCQGEEKEVKEWFKTINIVGVPLNEQELRNAIYSGTFVNAAKRVFSNSQNAEIHKWGHYVKGDVKRQEVLRVALEWVCASRGMTVDAYMSMHRHDTQITELENYFRSVIDWVSTTFTMVENNMCGIEWGRLYETYHTTPYSIEHITERVKTLLEDDAVRCSRNIYEYVLGGEQQHALLDVRFFDDKDKKAAFKRQTEKAQKEGVSNCPLCAIGDNNNRTRIYKINEMDADHVTAWSKGGATTLDNCEMLCKSHNRAKGNK